MLDQLGMEPNPESYTRSVSHTLMLEVCRISRRPAEKAERERSELRRVFHPSRDKRKPQTIEVRYIGGPEGCWKVRARGEWWHVCGGWTVGEAFQALSGSFATWE